VWRQSFVSALEYYRIFLKIEVSDEIWIFYGENPADHIVKPPKTALRAKIAAVKDTQKGNYTNDSWNAFQSALNAAQAVEANAAATHDEIDSALNALNAAVAGLRVKTVFSTSYEATFINWLLFFLGFGFIWMWLAD